ncbi:MAG: hypothetical protein WBC73_13975 [Phormidesmis sp.]
MWRTKYTLASIVLGICLLAIFGVSRAVNWLNQSAATATEDRIPVTSVNDNTSDEPSDDSFISQADGTGDGIEGDVNLNALPLEEAGSYIQRQKSMEEDPQIAGTQVNVIAAADAADDNATTAQPTTVTPSPSPSPAPATTSPAAPAVPALW